MNALIYIYTATNGEIREIKSYQEVLALTRLIPETVHIYPKALERRVKAIARQLLTPKIKQRIIEQGEQSPSLSFWRAAHEPCAAKFSLYTLPAILSIANLNKFIKVGIPKFV